MQTLLFDLNGEPTQSASLPDGKLTALKFNLSGKTAIFKRPDVNSNCLFTYSHIHKPALLGILGAICGFGGYNQQKAGNEKYSVGRRKADVFDYPEYYEKLKDIKVAIIPKEPTFVTKNQSFNNSVGYASKEEGGNLIVVEQWLENPSWEIFVMLGESEVSENLKNRFLNREFVYIPYLGKNDHFANITDIEIVELQSTKNCKKIDSLIFAKYLDKVELSDDDDDEIPFKYMERLPVSLDKEDNLYVLEKFVFTNMDVALNPCAQIYECAGRNISFF